VWLSTEVLTFKNDSPETVHIFQHTTPKRNPSPMDVPAFDMLVVLILTTLREIVCRTSSSLSEMPLFLRSPINPLVFKQFMQRSGFASILNISPDFLLSWGEAGRNVACGAIMKGIAPEASRVEAALSTDLMHNVFPAAASSSATTSSGLVLSVDGFWMRVYDGRGQYQGRKEMPDTRICVGPEDVLFTSVGDDIISTWDRDGQIIAKTRMPWPVKALAYHRSKLYALSSDSVPHCVKTVRSFIVSHWPLSIFMLDREAFPAQTYACFVDITSDEAYCAEFDVGEDCLLENMPAALSKWISKHGRVPVPMSTEDAEYELSTWHYGISVGRADVHFIELAGENIASAIHDYAIKRELT